MFEDNATCKPLVELGPEVITCKLASDPNASQRRGCPDRRLTASNSRALASAAGTTLGPIPAV